MKRKINYPVVLHTKVSPETKDKLDKLVEAMNLSYSELIRSILEDYTK